LLRRQHLQQQVTLRLIAGISGVVRQLVQLQVPLLVQSSTRTAGIAGIIIDGPTAVPS
jgi:hypothetical protein